MFKIGNKVIAFKNNEEYEGEIVEIQDIVGYKYKIIQIKLLNGDYLITREDFIRYK